VASGTSKAKKMPQQELPERVRKWLKRVEYDMQTAEAMLQTKRFIYAIFMCQQAIEKCFKAMIASQGREILPLHNLRRLAEVSAVTGELTDDQLLKLDFLSQYYINARYKEDIEELSRGITEEFSKNIIDFSKEMIEWIAKRIQSY
jgi:HEPN domain-containing protein